MVRKGAEYYRFWGNVTKRYPRRYPRTFLLRRFESQRLQTADSAPPIRSAVARAVGLRSRSEGLSFDTLIGVRF